MKYTRLAAASTATFLFVAVPAQAASIEVLFPTQTAPSTIDCSELDYADPHHNLTSPKGDFSWWDAQPELAQSIMDRCTAAQAAAAAPQVLGSKTAQSTQPTPAVLPKTGVGLLPLVLAVAAAISGALISTRRTYRA